MFASARSFGTQVLGIATRGVEALEGIVEAILVLDRAVDGAITEQRAFRPLVHTLDKLVLTLEATEKLQREHGPAMERVDALELSRVRFEAECEGMLLKAEGKHKAASAAEARERQLRRAQDKRDPFGEDADDRQPATEEGQALLEDVFTGAGADRALEDVAQPEGKKARALRAKWGV